MRKLRFIPEGGALVEVTTRTLHGRYLMKPSPQLNEIVVGVLAKAQEYSPVRVCALVFMSSHYHLLLHVDDGEKLANFMCYFNSNLAREIARLYDWPEKIWGRRFEGILTTDEVEAQIARLRYVLRHGVKEGFFVSPTEWLGANSVGALLTGEPMQGVWFDRTRESAADRRGETFGKYEHATRLELRLDPLPCWRHLEPEQVCERVAEMVEEIEREASEGHRRNGTEPKGREAVLREHPHYRPNRLKKSPAPSFHAFRVAAGKQLREAYNWFESLYREAAERLRDGDRDVEFPEGSFPPRLPFVRPGLSPAPA
jgi:REP element-mobilizing transposase RayT